MEINYRIVCEREDLPVEGNASAWGDESDKELADAINARLDAGDIWAWCYIRVIAEVSYQGQPFKGEAALGCGSYASEAEFRSGSDYEDLCDNARDALKENLDNIVSQGIIADSLKRLL